MQSCLRYTILFSAIFFYSSFCGAQSLDTTLASWEQNSVFDGSIIGLNENLLHAYVEFIANKRLKALGLKTIYDRPVSQNPLPWTQHWLSSAGLQVAPQETEVESYIIGGVKQDVEKDTFKGFKL